jgi:probable addiction module antidote protein
VLYAGHQTAPTGVIHPRFDAPQRVRGMTKLAKRTGLTRMGLYKALSKDGNPSLDTVLRVLHALDLRLSAKAV